MLEYAFVTLKSMYHLATASVCVLDSYWPAVSVLHHKKQLAVIQMWHAMGKIKKSGYQSLGKKFGRSDMIAREMRMHRNYDVVIAGGRAFNPFYCASFDVEPDILYNVGLPRMDKLREGSGRSPAAVLRDLPRPERQKRSCFMPPTFRKGQTLDPKALVDAFNFDGSQMLVIKRHPNQLFELRLAVPGDNLPQSADLDGAVGVRLRNNRLLGDNDRSRASGQARVFLSFSTTRTI